MHLQAAAGAARSPSTQSGQSQCRAADAVPQTSTRWLVWTISSPQGQRRATRAEQPVAVGADLQPPVRTQLATCRAPLTPLHGPTPPPKAAPAQHPTQHILG